MERYRDPRVLQCAHHFCKVCLEEIADRHPQGSVTCPTCRHVTPIEGESGVDDLPPYKMADIFVEKVEVFAKDGVNRIVNKYCRLCKDGTTIATRTCLTCRFNFCDHCLGKHKIAESTSGHTTFPILSYMYCDVHDDVTQWICHTCDDKYCCPECIMTRHNDHDLEDIKAAGEDARKRLRKTKDQIDSSRREEDIASRIQQMLKNGMEQLDLIKTCSESIGKSMNSLTSKLTDIQNEATSNLKSAVKQLQMMSADVDQYIDSKHRLRKVVTNLIEDASDAEVVTRAKQAPRYDWEQFLKTVDSNVKDVHIGTKLQDIATKLDKFTEDLRLDYPLATVHGPMQDLYEIADFTSGANVTGMTIDIKHERIVVRKRDTVPIHTYSYSGELAQ